MFITRYYQYVLKGHDKLDGEKTHWWHDAQSLSLDVTCRCRCRYPAMPGAPGRCATTSATARALRRSACSSPRNGECPA